MFLHGSCSVMDCLGSVRRYLVEEGQLELFCFGCRTLLRGGFFSGRAGLNAVGQRGLQIIKKLLRIRVRSSPVVPLIQIHNGQGVASTVAIITNIGRFVACECFDKVVHFHTRTVGLHVFHQAHYVLSGSTCNTILFEDGLGRAGVADGFWRSIGRCWLHLFRSLDFQQVLIYPSTRGFETALTCCVAQQLAGGIQQRFFSGRIQRTTLNQVLGAFQLTEQLDGRTDTLWNMNVTTVQNIISKTETGSRTFGALFRCEQFIHCCFSAFGFGVICQAVTHCTLFGRVNFSGHLTVGTSGIGLRHTLFVCLQCQFTIYVVRQAWVDIAWDSQRRVRAWQCQWRSRLRLGLSLRLLQWVNRRLVLCLWLGLCLTLWLRYTGRVLDVIPHLTCVLQLRRCLLIVLQNTVNVGTMFAVFTRGFNATAHDTQCRTQRSGVLTGADNFFDVDVVGIERTIFAQALCGGTGYHTDKALFETLAQHTAGNLFRTVEHRRQFARLRNKLRGTGHQVLGRFAEYVARSFRRCTGSDVVSHCTQSLLNSETTA